MYRYSPIFVLAIACSSPVAAPEPVVPVHDAAPPAERFARRSPGWAQPNTRRWFAGDVHMHVSPPDDPADVTLGVAQIASAARDGKLDFVVLTPHLWPARRGATFARDWRAMAAAARAETPTLIPGVEWSTREGHFTVAGTDVTALGGDFLASARRASAFVSVNHPFAVPTNIPGVGASHFDMSYKAWTTPNARAEPIAGVEVFNLPLALANLVSKPGGKSGEERAWIEADRVVRTEHRRITTVGGTDNHKLLVVATTWVLAVDASERSILDALRGGATCVGGVEAGSFRARGDDLNWVGIGEVVHATQSISLGWDGIARLFVDGIDQGERSGGFAHATNGSLHTYRIVRGASRSGFIYANL